VIRWGSIAAVNGWINGGLTPCQSTSPHVDKPGAGTGLGTLSAHLRCVESDVVFLAMNRAVTGLWR